MQIIYIWILAKHLIQYLIIFFQVKKKIRYYFKKFNIVRYFLTDRTMKEKLVSVNLKHKTYSLLLLRDQFWYLYGCYYPINYLNNDTRSEIGLFSDGIKLLV